MARALLNIRRFKIASIIGKLQFVARPPQTVFSLLGDKENNIKLTPSQKTHNRHPIIAEGTLKRRFEGQTIINSEDDYDFTSPIDNYTGNELSMFDMHGNVMEWCLDWHDDEYYSASSRDDTVDRPAVVAGAIRLRTAGQRALAGILRIAGSSASASKITTDAKALPMIKTADGR